VRLKGGDPFLFGRGGEEMEALTNAGIPCEPVPGVTSATAVPAYAGIPVTHRDYASSLHIVTAHRRDGEPVDYGTLARLEGTLVFLMGEVREICQRLMEAGMDENTPAALVEWGTTARQRQVTGILGDLADRAEQFRSSSSGPAPAVVIVGRVAALAETLDWRKRLSLSGRRVLVSQASREKKGGPGLAELLRSRGAEVLVVASRTEAIDVTLPRLDGYEWLVFTSAAGVGFFFDRLRADRRDIREAGAAKIAAVGPATREAIESRGLRVDLIPPVYSGAALGDVLLHECRDGAARLLLLRAEGGAPDPARILRDGGIGFDEVFLYRTAASGAAPGFDPGEVEAAAFTVAAFTSASSVRGLAALCPNVRLRAACIGEQTGEAAREAGYEVRIAKKATLEDLADTVESMQD
jgi:uroporphyrinogen III methyltransferase/synthase